MATNSASSSKVDARVVYWGGSGAGKTTNLRAIQTRLGSTQRDAIEAVPTRLDPSVCYHRLAIELGGKARARLELVAVPGAPQHAVTRKQLLDCVGGIVFVADASADRSVANLASLEELRASLAAYGRRLETIPTVVQYNKTDLATPASLDDLRDRLNVPGAATMDAIAEQQSGVMETLTEIAKAVARNLRSPTPYAPTPPSPPLSPPPVTPRPAAEPIASESPPVAPDPEPDSLVRAALAVARGRDDPASDQVTTRARNLLEPDWGAVAAAAATAGEWSIAELGEAELTGPRALSLPLTIADGEGAQLRLQLRISLESAED